jgi:hypothetical protein
VGLGYKDPDPFTGEFTFLNFLAEQSHLSDTFGDQEWSPSHKHSSWYQQVVNEQCEASSPGIFFTPGAGYIELRIPGRLQHWLQEITAV